MPRVTKVIAHPLSQGCKQTGVKRARGPVGDSPPKQNELFSLMPCTLISFPCGSAFLSFISPHYPLSWRRVAARQSNRKEELAGSLFLKERRRAAITSIVITASSDKAPQAETPRACLPYSFWLLPSCTDATNASYRKCIVPSPAMPARAQSMGSSLPLGRLRPEPLEPPHWRLSLLFQGGEGSCQPFLLPILGDSFEF